MNHLTLDQVANMLTAQQPRAGISAQDARQVAEFIDPRQPDSTPTIAPEVAARVAAWLRTMADSLDAAATAQQQQPGDHLPGGGAL